jgi:hypothetical protein
VNPRFLKGLYEPDTPVASVYLDTSREGDDSARALELRWHCLRESLAAHDADPETVQAIEGVIGTDAGIAGEHGQAVFASAGQVLLNERLPDPPARSLAHYGALPTVLPLLLSRAPDIPYAVLTLHRVSTPRGARAKEDLDVGFEVGRWPWSRVNSTSVQRRIPLTDWGEEAERILGRLTGEGEVPELVVLAGDPWAENTLLRLVPDRLRDRFLRLDDPGTDRPEPGRAILEQELGRLMADRLAEQDRRRLDLHLAQRARNKDVTGLAAAVSALQRGEAAALLINHPLTPTSRLWAGPAPTDLALAAADLGASGVGYYWEEDAAEALVRAAVGTRADVIAVPADRVPLAEGLAVLPLWADLPREPLARIAGSERA